MADVTRILSAIEQGDPTAAEQLLPLVYDELRKLAPQKMAQEAPGQTLQATALVHEAYLRLVDVEKAEHWKSRGHFLGAAAEAMRRILVENARRKARAKHGAGWTRLDLDQIQVATAVPSEMLLALDEALRELTDHDPPGAELVMLRFFAGLSIAEETLEAFVERFDEVAAGLLTVEDLTPLLLIDGELEPAEITSKLLETVESLKPFGMGNPEPVFLLQNAAVVDCRTLKETHLKMRLSASGRTFEAIGFAMAGRAAKGDLLDVVFSPAINVWNGKTSLQLTIKDLRRAGE